VTRSVTTIEDVHKTFLAWFGDQYDLAAIDVALATKAAERLTGDPLWTLLISGSGNAKTETVCSLSAAGALITSTITSDGALLSASPRRERAKDATGGLLQRLGASGMLVIKDVTSILSMDRNTRAGVLAALREIHDGRWERNVGTDGGRTLTWTGRIAVLGACTTAWDRAHDVVASMGDRFVVLRVDSSVGRQTAGYKAMANTGDELRMRAALAQVVAGVLSQVQPDAAIRPTPAETDQLLAAADVVTRCRTGVDYDYRGDVIDAHAPEMPTRLAKQLIQVLRGACAVGLPREQALQLALRCARDSMPPLRLAIVEDVAANPHTRCRDVRQRLNKPYNTVDRQLQALHMLGVLDCDEVEDASRHRSSWYYSVNSEINVRAIRVPDLLPHTQAHTEKKSRPSHISGTREATSPNDDEIGRVGSEHAGDF
jgi:hypothetical protein